MLLCFQSMSDEEHARLMRIYQQSNRENVPYFFPDCKEETEGIRRVEENFITFLCTNFWDREENVYYVWEEDGEWASALRLTRLKECYWVEALETVPGLRRKGYAAKLYQAIFKRLGSSDGTFRVQCCVGQGNHESLRTHESVGFQIKSRQAVNLLYNEPEEGCCLLEYVCLSL